MKTRILVVEDESVVAMDIAATLRRLGYDVVDTVLSGAEAIEAAKILRPDLILMDIRIKGEMDGIEAAAEIHRTRQVPIVFLTAHADLDTIERSKGAAPYGYVLKPFDERLLHRTIEIALNRASVDELAQDEALDALWRSEERFRLMVDAVKEYALFMVGEDGLVVSWNSGAERITGFTADEVLGKPVTALRADEESDQPTFQHRVADGGAAGAEWDEVAVRKDGSSYLAHVYGAPMISRGGHRIGFVGVTKDVTKQRDLEAQLLQAQKLESIAHLAGGIAHDFNNMLMVILTRCELLLRILDSEKQRKYVADIRDAAQKNRDLTQQLLALARRQVLQLHTVSLNDVVTEAIQLLRPALGERIDTQLVLEPALWNVHADKGKMHQVLLNLAINARDAMPQGGALVIETRNVRVDETYAKLHIGLTEGDFVSLTVSDAGAGIPREIRDRIYDPFFTTKPPGQGTGLGLAVVRGIVEQSGGRIWMYSEEDHGTIFKIFLPRHVGAEDAPADVEDERELPGGNETILLVEDEMLLRKVMRETLEDRGYKVLAASTPREALEICRRPDPIHLLLSDVVMPGMEGRHLAELICETRPNLPVILMSGYTDHVVGKNGYADAKTQFLEKPIATAALLRAVREALDRAGVK
jgi:PAS domain S-box-containing protein